MANLTITNVHIVRIFEMEPDGPVNEVVAVGVPVRVDATTGKYTPSNATTTTENQYKGIAVNTGDYANATISVMRKGILDVGNALSGINYGLPVYLSDTDGTLADAAGTVSTIVGYVMPGFASTTPDKLLLVI
jgi:hypothetical protein